MCLLRIGSETLDRLINESVWDARVKESGAKTSLMQRIALIIAEALVEACLFVATGGLDKMKQDKAAKAASASSRSDD